MKKLAAIVGLIELVIISAKLRIVAAVTRNEWL